MKRTIALVLMLLLMMSALSGCVVDREKDMAQVVAVVGERTITKQELYAAMQEYLDGQGYSYDVLSEDMTSSDRTNIDNFAKEYLDYLVMEEICVQIVDKTMPLTEEEIKAMNTDIDSYIALIQYYYLKYDPAKPDEYKGDIDADTEKYFAENIMPIADMRAQVERETKMEKLYNSVAGEISADDAAVKALYDGYVESQKKAADSSDKEYQTAITAGSDSSSSSSSNAKVGTFVIYKAKDYRMVTHILLKYSDDQASKIDAKYKLIDAERDKLDAAQTAYDTASKAYDAAVTSGNKDEQAKQSAIMTEQKAIVDTQTATVQSMMVDYQAYREEVAADLIKQANEIIARANAGESFDALIKEYNKDTGLDSAPYSYYGYCIPADGSGFDSSFASAALLLNTDGELSGAVVSDYGVHIIKLLHGPEACALPYETVKPLLQTEADSTAKSNAWNAYVEAYKKDNGVKVYGSRATWK